MVRAVSQTSCGFFMGSGGLVLFSLWLSSRIWWLSSSSMKGATSSWLMGPALEAIQWHMRVPLRWNPWV